ncbi:MAG: AAA family ATPase [Steroidobacteraceae bacterium]
MSTVISVDSRIPGFEVLWRDVERVLCRGWRESADGGRMSVLAVVPAANHPQPQFLRRLAHELELKDSLDPAWAARPLDLVRERSVLFLEDRAGEPLGRLVGRPMQMGQFLRIAVALAVAVDGLHGSGLIHKDIKPGNVLVNATTAQAWLTGFGIASRAPLERQSPTPPEVIAGTFAYMAPEQTGRMNRSIDMRSDLYSLGVTFYEMLTGVLPFTASDPMEWIHCHIARQATAPAERIDGIPALVSSIVMKLLSKAAEDRYQTADGLRTDLERCLVQWQAGGRIDAFPLAARDASGQLRFPEQLYGREAEIDSLVAAFNRVVEEGACGLALVSGYSGIGKSSVVNELHKALVPARGLFAAGKFNQYMRGIPYATLAQAFQCLVLQLLSKNDADLARWRNELTHALGSHGQLMINLVPELALIIGEQPQVPTLSGPEAQSRFLLVVRQFLGVFATTEHPLVLFLDDLQWLDSATLDAFEYLATQSQVRHLLLVGAYRSNEVGIAHPLALRLESIRTTRDQLLEVVLGGIGPEDITRMIADALHAQPRDVGSLARIVEEKTAGNPFFMIQFVGALVDDGLLKFDRRTWTYRWEEDRVKAKRVGDNVVELTIERLARLSIASLQALKQLACLGSSVQIAKLHEMLGISAQEAQQVLREAMRMDLVLQVDDAYAFAHDRVHEAVYALLPKQDRAEAHRQIGLRLLAQLTDTEVGDRIFEIAGQLNLGASACVDPVERATAASLNLRAGRKAKSSAAYAAACVYLAEGRLQIQDDGWEADYELAFALGLEHAECTFLSGAFDDTERMIASVLREAKTDLHRASLYRLRIELHVVRSENGAAIDNGLVALKLFGIDLPPHPHWSDVQAEYDDVWNNLDGRPLEFLAELPAMTDPRMLAATRILAEIWPPAYFTDSNLTILAICRMVNISLRHGAASTSIQGYALLGWLMGPAFGRYREGYRITWLAHDLAVKWNLPLDMARTGDTMGLTSSWTQPLTASIEWSRAAYRQGIEAGDLYFACYSSAHITTHLLMRGHDLEQDAKECKEYLDFARGIGFRDGADLIVTSERTIASLRGMTHSLSSFGDEEFDETQFEAELTPSRMNVVTFWYWTRKTMVHFLAGDCEAALLASGKVRTGPRIRIMQVQHLDYHYYTALALVAQIEQSPADRRQGLRRRLDSHYRQLKTWADDTLSPTFADKHVLIAAEISRIEGRELDAQRLYEESIRLARQNGFLQNEALANELAARFYERRGFEKIARMYLLDARNGYMRWGAIGKVRQLDGMLPRVIEERRPIGSTDTVTAPVDQLDFATVLRISQAVSGEIVPDRMIDTLLRTAIEHAGAQRAVLILPRGAEYEVEAEAMTSAGSVSVQLRKDLTGAVALPESIVRYVARTRESVILEDASAANPLFEDAYIRQHRARSLLCMPLTNRANLIGLLYLENNLLPRAITPARLAILKLIASQAAISLENTRLYADLEAREARIRRLVDANIIGIIIWDLDGRFIAANDAFLRMVQYDRADLDAGLRWVDMTPADWREADAVVIEGLEATGTMQPYEKEFFRKDGTRVPILMGAASFDDQPRQGVAFILDLTERKQAEERARGIEKRYLELQSDLAHANRVATMGQLSAWIAHDVRQPLVGIVTSGDAALRWLAADPPDVGAAQRALVRVVREGHRAAEVLDRIRALVRKAPTQKEEVDVNQLISETIVLVGTAAQRKGIAVQDDLADDVPLVHADRIQIQQVILNLMMNAIEAMAGDMTVKRKLLVRSWVDDANRACVAVLDSGPGLPLGSGDRLFDAFYTTKPDGLGMGLAICRTIIESHVGRIWATPNTPRGTIFQFALPSSVEQSMQVH